MLNNIFFKITNNLNMFKTFIMLVLLYCFYQYFMYGYIDITFDRLFKLFLIGFIIEIRYNLFIISYLLLNMHKTQILSTSKDLLKNDK